MSSAARNFCQPVSEGLLDCRIFDPCGDGRTEIARVQDMLGSCIYRQLQFCTVLMDTWYAAKALTLYIENLKKPYYCPIKADRPADDSDKTCPYTHAESPDGAAADRNMVRWLR